MQLHQVDSAFHKLVEIAKKLSFLNQGRYSIHVEADGNVKWKIWYCSLSLEHELKII